MRAKYGHTIWNSASPRKLFQKGFFGPLVAIQRLFASSARSSGINSLYPSVVELLHPDLDLFDVRDNNMSSLDPSFIAACEMLHQQNFGCRSSLTKILLLRQQASRIKIFQKSRWISKIPTPRVTALSLEGNFEKHTSQNFNAIAPQTSGSR